MALSEHRRQQIIASFNAIEDRHGWDFSRLRARRAPTPWDYQQVVRQRLSPGDHVLDIGTGGGEKLIAMKDAYGSAVGIDVDPGMIDAARSNLPSELAGRIEFTVGAAADLPFEAQTFNAVLNRHSVVNADEAVRVLRPGGLYINQDVGPRNLQALVDPWLHMGEPDLSDPQADVDQFKALDCEVIEFREYDVEYVFLDEESLLFQLKAMPMPVQVDPVRDAEMIAQLMDSTRGSDGGFHSNEHRFLKVFRKPA